jgi:hypothetical protein
MSGFPTASHEHIPGDGRHDDSEKQSCQHKERFNHVDELTDSAIRNHVNVTQQMMPPPHLDGKYQGAVDMFESVSSVTKQVKNDCSILHVRDGR